MNDWNPKIIAFVCNWCSYAAADQVGGQKLSYPSEVKLVRVMCSGRIDPKIVMNAFRDGADGVMVLGCHPGDCHYRNGNHKTLRRFHIFEKMLAQFGIHSERFKRDWISAAEFQKFQKTMIEMTETVKKLGPLQLMGCVQKGVLK